MSSLIYIYFEIPKAQNAQQKLKVSPSDLEAPSPFDNIFNSDTSSSDNNNNNNNKIKKITFCEYDLIIWQRKFKQTCIAITIIPLLHYAFGLTVPLVMSVILNIMGLLDDPLFRIYFRKHKPDHKKELVRPFKFSKLKSFFLSLQIKQKEFSVIFLFLFFFCFVFKSNG